MPALARDVDGLELVLRGISAEHLDVRGELSAELGVDRVVDLKKRRQLADRKQRKDRNRNGTEKQRKQRRRRKRQMGGKLPTGVTSPRRSPLTTA